MTYLVTLNVMGLEGLLLIDGNDAYTTYGAVVLKGGHNGLIQWPTLKEVVTNDWHEYDGIEADLSSPVLGSKEFPVDFYIFGRAGRLARLKRLVSALRNGSYHTMNFAAVGKTAKLRVVSFGEPEFCSDGLRIAITFADDFPLSGYEYLEPSSQVPVCYDYKIDDVPFTDYGVRVIEGSLKAALNMADVKKNLLRDISILPGVIYDDPAEDEPEESEEEEEETEEVDVTVRLSFRDLKLRCFLMASSLSEFWRNYDALLYDLVQPGARVVYSVEASKKLECYYGGSEIEKLSLSQYNGSIGMIFSISFKVLNETDVIRLLATETSEVLTTETGSALEVEFSF